MLPLSLAETRAYIQHRLLVSKGNPTLFKDSAITKVFELSKGIPRIINIICHSALLGAYSTDNRAITPLIIKQAAKETLTLADEGSPKQLLMPLLMLLVFTGLTAVLYQQHQSEPTHISPQPKAIVPAKLPVNEKIPALPPLAIAPSNSKPMSVTETKPFGEWLNNPDLTLSAALAHSLRLWGKETPTDQPIDCNFVQKTGLSCLFDRGNWKDILAFDRPVVLEFSLSPTNKRYALLTSLKTGQPILHFDKDLAFPLAEVLSFWDGYYLLLWQPPNPENKTFYPGQVSTDVEWLRQQLTIVDGINQNSKNPLFFDAELKARVINFQRTRQLTPDGKVGSQTIFHLDNATGAKGSPHLKQD